MGQGEVYMHSSDGCWCYSSTIELQQQQETRGEDTQHDTDKINNRDGIIRIKMISRMGLSILVYHCLYLTFINQTTEITNQLEIGRLD